MIHLHFEGVSPVYSPTLGPAPWFRVAGNFIRQGPGGLVVARLTRHQWQVDGQFFTRYDCRGRAAVHFEDQSGEPSEDFGPFAKLHAADGTIYADGKLLAKFHEEVQLWHAYPTETYWPTLVIKPAA